MAVVSNISDRAKQALKARGISYSFGYGEVYHFRGLPGTSSVEIDAPFTLGAYHFIVKGESLLLADEWTNDLEPLNEKEQRDLVALFQAFLKLKNAPDLRLHFYADTGGGLVFTGGIYDRQIVQWHDMAEGLATIRAMRETESEDVR